MLYQPGNQIMSNQTCMHGGQRSKENKPRKGGVGEEPPPGSQGPFETSCGIRRQGYLLDRPTVFKKHSYEKKAPPPPATFSFPCLSLSSKNFK